MTEASVFRWAGEGRELAMVLTNRMEALVQLDKHMLYTGAEVRGTTADAVQHSGKTLIASTPTTSG